MSDAQREIVLKTWDRYQSLIASVADSCWKIRSVFYTVSFGLIAAGFSSNVRALYLLVPLVAVGFFFLEAGYQQFQLQYILKSNAIEVAINDILANEEEPRLPDRVETSPRAFTVKDFGGLFKLRRYLFWLSYLVIIVLSLMLFIFNATKARF